MKRIPTHAEIPASTARRTLMVTPTHMNGRANTAIAAKSQVGAEWNCCVRSV